MRKVLTGAMIAGSLAVALTAGVLVGRATANQPHMQLALDALQTARTQLQTATADKGGHRLAAIGYVDRAITETRAGIQYAQ